MLRTLAPLARCLLGLSLASMLGSCAALQNLNLGQWQPKAPRVLAGQPVLVQAPTNLALAAHFCPQVAPGLVCQALGGPPPPQALKFAFDLPLQVHNDNPFPVPVAEVLAAFTAWPGSGQQNLGAVCLSLCQAGEPCAQSGTPPCQAQTGRDIRTLGDFGHAVAGLLVANAAGQTSLADVRLRTVPAGGQAAVNVRLELGVQAALGLVQRMAGDAVARIKQGQSPQFAIPWQMLGTVWVDVDNFGRIGAGFGPLDGAWKLQ